MPKKGRENEVGGVRGGGALASALRRSFSTSDRQGREYGPLVCFDQTACHSSATAASSASPSAASMPGCLASITTRRSGRPANLAAAMIATRQTVDRDNCRLGGAVLPEHQGGIFQTILLGLHYLAGSWRSGKNCGLAEITPRVSRRH